MITYVKNVHLLYAFVYNCIFYSLLVYLNKSSSPKKTNMAESFCGEVNRFHMNTSKVMFKKMEEFVLLKKILQKKDISNT